MQFLTHSQRTILPAEYKYLESLRLEASLFSPQTHLSTNLHLLQNKQSYNQLDLHSLKKQTSKCLPTAKTTPPAVALPAQAARSCVVPLVATAPPNAEQLVLAAP